MDKELKKIQEHYSENYFNKGIADRIKGNVQQGIHKIDTSPREEKQSRSITKRISFIAAACLILFALFLGSAFVSPAMAEVVSKIPLLNRIFEQEPIGQVIQEQLENQGYEINGSGYSVRDKTFFVSVKGSEGYYNQVKEEIEKDIKELVSSRGYDDFKVEVAKETAEPVVIVNNPNDRIRERVNKIVYEELVPKLIKKVYNIQSDYLVDSSFADSEVISIDLTIADTENRKEEIEKTILEEIKKQEIEEVVKVKFHSINVQAKETEMQWSMEVLPVIFEGMLNKKEYKTKGVAYSFKKGTMNIYIRTKVDKSDKEAPELAEKIERAIDEFLQSDDLKDIVGDTPYRIIVEDKQNKNIN